MSASTERRISLRPASIDAWSRPGTIPRAERARAERLTAIERNGGASSKPISGTRRTATGRRSTEGLEAARRTRRRFASTRETTRSERTTRRMVTDKSNFPSRRIAFDLHRAPSVAHGSPVSFSQNGEETLEPNQAFRGALSPSRTVTRTARFPISTETTHHPSSIIPPVNSGESERALVCPHPRATRASTRMVHPVKEFLEVKVSPPIGIPHECSRARTIARACCARRKPKLRPRMWIEYGLQYLRSGLLDQSIEHRGDAQHPPPLPSASVSLPSSRVGVRRFR